jgi:hypothetical protein
MRPLTQFCCGCQLSTGVYFIAFCHLLQCCFYVATTVSNIVFKTPTYNYAVPLATQTLNAALSLMGIPFILCAIYGLYSRSEPHTRLYFHYLCLAFAVDLVYIVLFFVMADTCRNLPSVMKEHGKAFACGAMRVFSVIFIVLITIIQSYFIFTVWSFCEDLKTGGSALGLAELKESMEDKRQKKRSGLRKDVTGSWMPDYGAFGKTENLNPFGSEQIFNGRFHEIHYPPPQSGRV